MRNVWVGAVLVGLAAMAALPASGQIPTPPAYDDGSTSWTGLPGNPEISDDGTMSMHFDTDEEGKPGSKSEGYRRKVRQTISARAEKCPTPDGRAPGHYKLDFAEEEVPVGGGAMVRTTALFEGDMVAIVGPDAMIQRIEVDVAVRRTAGSKSSSYNFRFAFTPKRSDKLVQWEASRDDGAADSFEVADRFFVPLYIKLFTADLYERREQDWRVPNECVQLSFSPPSNAVAMKPGDDVDLDIELKTIKEQAPPAASRFLATPSGGARVEPAEQNGSGQGKASVNFVAGSPTPGGVKVRATSNSGVAEAAWQPKKARTYKFDLRVASELKSGGMPKRMATVATLTATLTEQTAADGSIELVADAPSTITLVHTIEPATCTAEPPTHSIETPVRGVNPAKAPPQAFTDFGNKAPLGPNSVLIIMDEQPMRVIARQALAQQANVVCRINGGFGRLMLGSAFIPVGPVAFDLDNLQPARSEHRQQSFSWTTTATLTPVDR